MNKNLRSPSRWGACGKKTTFLVGALYGALLFLLVYGPRVLDVTYDDWLLTGGDLSQHYIGWLCYRNSPWHFPPGLMSGLNDPGMTSIVFTDSIPHFALLFKILSPLLPQTFQYFGLFGILSLALMGGFSALLLNHFLSSPPASVVLSTFFVLSPYILQRLYAHTALGGGQWLIVASLWLWLCHPFAGKKWAVPLCWCGLALAAGGIHMYFLPMVFAILGMWCLERLLAKQPVQAIGTFAASVAVVLADFWFYGIFYGSETLKAVGLGENSANLNALFDAQNTSLFLKELPHMKGQNEGYGYLGLGAIVLLALAVLVKVVTFRKRPPLFTLTQKIQLAVLLAFYEIVALSPVVTLGDRVILEIPLWEPIRQLWSVFRATGRFIWPVGYLVMFLSMATVFSVLSPRKWLTVLGAVLITVLQMADISPYLRSVYTNEKYRHRVTYTLSIHQQAWDHLLETKEHVIFQPAGTFVFASGGSDIALLAMRHHATISNFYFARSDYEELAQYNQLIQEELNNGITREDTIYVLTESDPALADYDLALYRMDQMIIGISQQDDVLEQMEGVERYLPATE